MNWYVYCDNNPVMFLDPTGFMTTKQFYSVFMPYYFYEACKNTVYSTEVSESVDSVYNIVKAVMSGNLDVNLNNFIEAVNPVSGTNMPNTYYVFSHLNYFNQDYVMTDEEVAAFAKSAGKIGLEIARAGSKIYLMFAQIKESIKELKVNNNIVPDKAIDIAHKIKSNNGIPLKGYKGRRIYKNIPLEDGAQKLPDGINYKEYDINPYIKGQNRGAERIVIGDDGSVWYTNDHYYTFIQIDRDVQNF